MDFLFWHLTIVQFLWGLKDFAFGDFLTISGEMEVELNSELSLNCHVTDLCRNAEEFHWDLTDESMAATECHNRSCVLKIDRVTKHDDGKYTCLVKCDHKTKKKSVIVTLYSLPKPVLRSTPETPWFGQPFNVTCGLRDFNPDTVELHLFRNDTPIKDVIADTEEEFVLMTATALNLQETTNTNYKCEARMTLKHKSMSSYTSLLVQPQESTTATFTTSTELTIPDMMFTWPATTEDDLLTPPTTTEGLDIQSETKDVPSSSSPGSIQTNMGLYVLVTLSAVACILSMCSVLLYLILRRRRKRHQEKTNDEEEMEKEKNQQQLPEMNTH